MKAQTSMNILRNLAQEEMDQAARQLGQVRQAQQAAEQQLSMLLDYQDEYRRKLNSILLAGTDSTRWQSYQQFIITLEHAIVQHRQHLAQWNEKAKQAVKYWQLKQQRLNAFETLHVRALKKEQTVENKRDQKQMDEFAQHLSQRSLNN